jgi:hypothetical protein
LDQLSLHFGKVTLQIHKLQGGQVGNCIEGVEFIDENGGGPGVRWRKRQT